MMQWFVRFGTNGRDDEGDGDVPSVGEVGEAELDRVLGFRAL